MYNASQMPEVPSLEIKPTVGEEIANSLSHGAGLALAIAATPILIVAATRYGTAWNMVGVSVFAVSMISLISGVDSLPRFDS